MIANVADSPWHVVIIELLKLSLLLEENVLGSAVHYVLENSTSYCSDSGIPKLN